MHEPSTTLLERAWADLRVEPAPIDSLVSQGRRTRRMRRATAHVGALGLAGGAIVVGLALTTGGAERIPVATDHSTSAELQTDLTALSVSPAIVRPGDSVTVSLPAASVGTGVFRLDARVETEWRERYFTVTSAAEAYGLPRWWSVDDPSGPSWFDVEVPGSDSGTVLVPNVAALGDYRICTATSGREVCADLQLVGP